jgi:AraC-like DNA-binding protein
LYIRAATAILAVMADETVRMWRPADQHRLLFMQGWTASYAVHPAGDYVVGVVDAGAMRASRRRERHLVAPGDLVAWDPSAPHAGSGVDGAPWAARLMVIELADLHRVLSDGDDPALELHLPAPVLRDRRLAAGFARVHAAMSAPASALERDTALAEFLHALATGSPADPRLDRRRRAARADPALRSACDYLGDRLTANVTLDQLADSAGVGKFRLIRLFRAAFGMPPHRFQLAHRVRLARRLLERGLTPADAAAAAGFVDQSHLHRHFRRSLGVTPRQYVTRLGSGMP